MDGNIAKEARESGVIPNWPPPSGEDEASMLHYGDPSLIPQQVFELHRQMLDIQAEIIRALGIPQIIHGGPDPEELLKDLERREED